MASPESTLILKIDSLTYGPYGVGRDGGRVVLVPLTAPGDEAEVRIRERKGRYSVAELSRLTRSSPARQPPPCPYFPECGGCPWQQVQYDAQLAAKEKNLKDALCRIGKLEGFDLLPILPSPQEYRYRRRIRLQTDDRRRLGFYRAFSHELIEIDSCLVAKPHVDRCISQTREWISRLKTQVQQVEIVAGDDRGEVVLAGRAKGEFIAGDERVIPRLLDLSEEISGLILFGDGWRRSWGQTKILMNLEGGLKMEVPGEGFSQVNWEGNSQLARELLKWGDFTGQDRVLELYAGAGNFTLPVARSVREVVAIEGDPRSAENGKTNSQLNGLKNIRWICSDASRGVRELREKASRFSKIVLNPPRSGAKGLEDALASLAAQKIFYLSCNPSTLARDLAALSRKGYRLKRVRPVDLFPHTFHVEALAEMVSPHAGHGRVDTGP